MRFGLGKLKNGHISPRANVDNVVGRLGINLPNDNPLYWGVPNIGVTGLSGIGEESDAPFINDDTTLQIVDNFTWTLGKHSFKFGGELRHVRYDQIGGVVTRGRWAFDGRYTQQPLLPAAQRGGSAFADFLLGHFNRSEGQVGAPIANFRSNYFALYAQDSWKLSQNLTVNYGLRWEYDQPFTDQNDAIVNIDFDWANSHPPIFVRTGEGDPYEGNPAFQLAPNIEYVRDGRFGRGAYRPDKNDFAPRLGVAWMATPKTVVRAGGGIYYVRDIGNAVFDTVRNAPFTIRRDEPAETFRPNLSYEQPFARTGAPTFILAAQWDEPSSYVGQWSVGVAARAGRQHEPRRHLLRVGGRPSAAAHELQQPGAEPAGELEPGASVPAVRQHPGDERARPLQLSRALREGAAALLAGPQLPQLVLLRQVDRQRQRRPHHRRRLADAVEQLRPGAGDAACRPSISAAAGPRRGSGICRSARTDAS